MIAPFNSVAVLLCAGLSRRYGAANKLMVSLRGYPLVHHAANLLASMPFTRRIAVVPPGEAALRRLLANHGFILAENPQPEGGKDRSLRVGLEHALAFGPTAVLVCLGDMPAISRDHLLALANAADEDRAAISASSGFRSPPVLIPVSIARKLLLKRERPVRECLASAVPVHAAEPMLADYDTVADFARVPA